MKPMPPRRETPRTSSQLSSSSRLAWVNRAVSQAVPRIPTGLPSTSPATMPSAIGSLRDSVRPESPPIATPAAKNAKIGTARLAERGRMRCSKCSASPGPASGPPAARERTTGTVKPSSTPATVAWMPDACTSPQVRAARGMQHPPRADPALHGPAEQRQRHHRGGQRHQVQVGGVEDRDDRDGDQVVHHGEGQQERPQAGGEVGADDGEDGQRERDVGRGRDGPARQRAAPAAQVDQDEDRRPGPRRRRGRRGWARPRGRDRAGRRRRTRA